MKHYILAIKTVVTGLLFLIVSNVVAQVATEPVGIFSMGPQIGYFKSQGADGGQVMWGGAARIKLGDVLGLEASVNYREEDFSRGAEKVKSWPVMVTGLLYPIPVLYGAVGAGWYNSSIEFNTPSGETLSSETSQSVGWHFGGGLELPVGTVAKIVGDVRYVFLDYKFQKLPGSDGSSSNFYVIDVGLLFNL
jgi:hypothetical protein